MNERTKIDLAVLMGPVARILWGEPDDESRKELRWGRGGSRSVSLGKNTWYDHEAKEGGGVLDLIKRETGAKGNAAAFRWLSENGLYEEAPRPVRTLRGKRFTLVKTWDYPGFQVVREEKAHKEGEAKPRKRFLQRRPNGAGGWIWNVDGITMSPYRPDELAEAIAADRVVFFVEGEKCADALRELGVPATTNPMGCGKWWDELDHHFHGARLVILPDNDPQATDGKGKLRFHPDGRPVHAGLDHAEKVAARLLPLAKEVKVLELRNLPLKGDIVDWLAAGGTVEQLYALADNLPPWTGPRDRIVPPDDSAAASAAGGDGLGSAATGWHKQLVFTRWDTPHPNAANIILELENDPAWAGVFYFDEFAHQIVLERPIPIRVGDPTPLSEPRPFSDADLTAALRWFQLSDYPTVGVDKVDLAIRAVAEGQRRRHPVREWLHTLKWDGVPRVDTWLITYCGAVPANELHAAFIRAIGSKWLISAIARIEKPGCKVDHCLVLEGPQGGGKSTVFAVLGGEWFTDALPGDLTSKDASDFVAGVWIVELSELNQVKRASVETLKSFITRTTERFRPAYGRHKSIFRRSCVFGGSTNQNAYLTDPTGGRRFWPVRIGNINLMALRADREQLWAEALFRYRQGEIWWLTEEQTIATAIEEQAARYEADPWEEAIAAKVAVMTGPITIPYLLKEVLNIDLGMQRRSESNRVAEILTSLGLSRGKLSKGVSQWVKINRK